MLLQRFLFLMTVKLLNVRNNLLEEMNPEWDRIVSKNTCFQEIFMGTEKRVKRFSDCKRIWKTKGKIKFRFILEPWTYFYLLLASLYLIQSKLKIFIHPFISSWLPYPNEWFQVELLWRKYNKKLHFWI